MIKMAFGYCRDCRLATRLRQLEKSIEHHIENARLEEAFNTWEKIIMEKCCESVEGVRKAWTDEIWGKWKGDEQIELRWREDFGIEEAQSRYLGSENSV